MIIRDKIQRIAAKKVSLLWLLAAIVFFLLCVVEIVMLILAGTGFNGLVGYIKDSHIACAEYCDVRGDPLYLNDVVTQACQCYNEAEEPTDYKNLRSGVEIEHKEKSDMDIIAKNYGLADCVFEGCEAGEVIIMSNNFETEGYICRN